MLWSILRSILWLYIIPGAVAESVEHGYRVHDIRARGGSGVRIHGRVKPMTY